MDNIPSLSPFSLTEDCLYQVCRYLKMGDFSTFLGCCSTLHTNWNLKTRLWSALFQDDFHWAVCFKEKGETLLLLTTLSPKQAALFASNCYQAFTTQLVLSAKIAVLLTIPYPIHALFPSPQGWVTAGTSNGQAQVFKGGKSTVVGNCGGSVTCCSFLPDGRSAMGTDNGQLFISGSHECKALFLQPLNEEIRAVIPLSSNRVVLVQEGERIQVVSLNGEKGWSLGLSTGGSGIKQTDFIEYSSYMVPDEADAPVRLWGLTEDVVSQINPFSNTPAINRVEVMHDFPPRAMCGTLLAPGLIAVAMNDSTIRIVNVDDQTKALLMLPLRLQEGEITCLSAFRCGCIAVGTDGGQILIVDPKKPSEPHQLYEGAGKPVTCLSFFEGQLLAAFGEEQGELYTFSFDYQNMVDEIAQKSLSDS